jgi:fibronectin type 3 domain-containing protein
LTWSPPTDDGGSQISSYTVYRGTYSYHLTELATTTSTGYTDSSVTNGDTYYYQVTATNAIGEGDRTTTVSATPTAEVVPPSRPQGLQANDGDGYVTLTWSPPTDDGGSQISSYTVYRGTYSYHLTELATTTSTGYTDSSVTNGETYYYEVSATNQVGEGERSSQVTVTPRSSDVVTVPGTPTNLWTESSQGTITLHWNPPTDDGGSTVTGYKVYRRTDGAMWYYVYKVGDIDSLTFYNLEPGELYQFSVCAYNDQGYGERSEEISATPSLSLPQHTLTKAPLEPVEQNSFHDPDIRVNRSFL